MIKAEFRKELIRLARKGAGQVSPNPLVGALVVRQGQIIARGYHLKFGGEHAEASALREAGKRARGADLLVTLEPCSHHGKTPPCAELIIKRGIAKVWIGSPDPNPLVAGRGIKRLRAAGIEVVEAYQECFHELNRPFFKYITCSMPWVVMKNAKTLDGRINNQPCYLSCPESLRAVHRMRNEMDAVAVGVNTVLSDDPALNVRLVRKRGPDALRVVFDSLGRTPLSARLFSQAGGQVVIFTTRAAEQEKLAELRKRGARVHIVSSKGQHVDLKKALKFLAGEYAVTSVLLEGGSVINAAMLDEKLVDEAAYFLTPNLWGGERGLAVNGCLKRKVELVKMRSYKIGSDILVRGELKYT